MEGFAGALLTILEWVVKQFGQINLVILAAAAYTMYLHKLEVAAHAATQAYVRALQEAFLKVQIEGIEALHDLSELLKEANKLRSRTRT